MSTPFLRRLGIVASACLIAVAAAGSIPAADTATWDLKPPPGVQTDNDFLLGLVCDLRSAPFDSQQVEDAVRDITLPDNRTHGIPTLCAAMAKDDFKNLFGVSHVAITLFKQGQVTLAKRMLPFLVAVSERTTEVDGLSAFAYIMPKYRDLRVVPILAKLLEHPNAHVKRDAATALSQLTLIPADSITPSAIRSWQANSAGKTPGRIWKEGLSSKDPQIAIMAAQMRFDDRDKDIMIAIVTVMRGTNTKAIAEARQMLEKITGNDWGFTAETSQPERVTLAAKLEKWWAGEKDSFEWMIDRGKPRDDAANQPAEGGAKQEADPFRELVDQLGSSVGVTSEQAESKLKEAGGAAIPALLYGLENGGPLIQGKCNSLLKSISKQDFGFNPRDEAGAMQAAITKWRNWAEAEKLIPGSDATSAADGTSTDQPQPEPPKPEPKKKKEGGSKTPRRSTP